jgi:hypothetical protein
MIKGRFFCLPSGGHRFGIDIRMDQLFDLMGSSASHDGK